jgi:hypothetical protein
MDIQLADVLTLPGALVSSGLVTAFVTVLKKWLPIIAARDWEQAIALAAALALVAVAFYDQRLYTLDAAFVAFAAWLGIAKLATGIYDEATRQPTAFTAPAGPTPAPAPHTDETSTVPAATITTVTVLQPEPLVIAEDPAPFEERAAVVGPPAADL